MNNEGIIKFCGENALIICNRKCNKAWGMNKRPKIQLSEDEDDYCYLSDNELKEAPIDPGTYECNNKKPETPNEFPNKWCVRECERSVMSNPGEWMLPLKTINFEKRFYNILSKNNSNQSNAADRGRHRRLIMTLYGEIMTDIEKGSIIAREIWDWLINKEIIELVPWVSNPKSEKYDNEKTLEQKGYKRCLKELREIIELKSKGI